MMSLSSNIAYTGESPNTQQAEIQNKVIQIWQKKLRLGSEPIDCSKTFLEYGGTSLLAISTTNRLNQTIALKLPFNCVFKHPTILSLTDYIACELFSDSLEKTNSREDFFSPQQHFDLSPKSNPFPLTELQEAYWVGEESVFEFGRKAFFYEEYYAESLDIDRLNDAINELVERHEALRTVFLDSGQQKILEAVPSYKVGYFEFQTFAKIQGNHYSILTPTHLDPVTRQIQNILNNFESS